jgi:hypothetical protein
MNVIKNLYKIKDDKKRYRFFNAYWKLRGLLFKIKRIVPCTYLCCKYPFLKINGINKKNTRFFQTSCWYYSIDEGWRRAFGRQLCDDLKESLKRYNYLKKYEITDVKEKYGELVIYDNGAPEEVHNILLKYEYISARTCIVCGRPAKYRTEGWVEPYCEDCIKNNGTEFKPLEFFKDIDWYGYKKI